MFVFFFKKRGFQTHPEFITNVFQVKILTIHLEPVKVFRGICLLLEALRSLELGWCTKKGLNFHYTVTGIP